jgi:hypothetical protein
MLSVILLALALGFVVAALRALLHFARMGAGRRYALEEGELRTLTMRDASFQWHTNQDETARVALPTDGFW